MISLTEMAFPRAKVIGKMLQIAPSFEEHITKCIVYGNSTNTLNHWIAEIANFLATIGNMKIKDKIKLSEDEYEEHLFSYLGDDYGDYLINLNSFKNIKVDVDKLYPDFEITDDMLRKYRHIVDEIRKKFMPMLVDKKKSYNINEYKKILEEIIF